MVAVLTLALAIGAHTAIFSLGILLVSLPYFKPEELVSVTGRYPIAAVVGAADPDLPLGNVTTMGGIVDESLLSDQFNTTLYGCFAGVALVLSAVGIYGAMEFAVAQRRHEIGLRMA